MLLLRAVYVLSSLQLEADFSHDQEADKDRQNQFRPRQDPFSAYALDGRYTSEEVGLRQTP